MSTEPPVRSVLKRIRNAEIVRLIDEDRVTQTAVGRWFELSKQRVHQIYKREKAKQTDV